MIKLEESQEDNEVRVHYYEEHCPTGWAGKVAVELIIKKEMLPIKKINAFIIGKDQGWGNTGHSRISLLILNHQKQLIHNIDMGITYHDEREYEVEIHPPNEILTSLTEGWSIGIWAISAPYPGYECKVKRAKLTILASYLWLRRKNWLLFLYNHGYQILQKQSNNNSNNSNTIIEYDQNNFLSKDQVFNNKDLCRYISMYL